MDDIVTIGVLLGWNLISLPFNPPNPAINAVLPVVHPADIVATQSEEGEAWVLSRRDAETGFFQGSVTVLTANTAYFLGTDRETSIQILRPPVQPPLDAPPWFPAIPVAQGWSLVPVLCTSRPMPEAIDADYYFGTLGSSWMRATTYDPATGTWDSVAPGYRGYVTIGKGYWLYTATSGVIVP